MLKKTLSIIVAYTEVKEIRREPSTGTVVAMVAGELARGSVRFTC